jgi:hypothetical protein
MHAYNLRSRDKNFQVGERVIYLMPSSTHKLTRTWQGPCVVLRKNSPYSYIIEVDGKQQWCNANHLRKYNERVNEVVNHNCAVIFDSDCDFGNIPTLQFNDQSTCNDVETNTHFDENEADERDVTYNDVTMPLQNLDGDETDEFEIFCCLDS